jgi:hypothetical protein
MLLMIQGEVMASGNPSALNSLLPGGANVQVAGTTPNPFLAGPRPEQIVREVIDVTAAAPAPASYLVQLQFAAGNGNGTNYIENTTTSVQLGEGMYGIVWRPAIAQGGQALIVTEGPVLAYCYTGGVTAITYGTPLVAGGGTNPGCLTAVASPTFGTIVGFSLGTLAISTGPTLLPVWMGGI